MRVALYSRVSTEEQTKGTSLETQLDNLTAWANRMGHTITGKYVDGGYSGKDDKRPRFQLMMSHANAKKFDAIATTKLDRFFRKLRLLLEYEDKLRQLGISYIATEENIDTSKDIGKMLFHIMGVVAEWERDRIAERTKGGRLKTWKKGKAASGKVLYGYRWDKENSKWLVDLDEARVVKAIFGLYVDQQMGMARIAEKLNQDGIGTGSHGWAKKGWTDVRVQWILHHPAYAGKQYMNRKASKDFQSGDITFDMPAIVDKQTWDLAQRRIASQKRIGRSNGNSFLLQGLIHCAECGYGYRCQTYGSGHRVYKCWGRSKVKHLDGSTPCSNKSIDADMLEELVWGKVRDCLQDSEILRQSILNSLDKVEQRKQELAILCRPVDEQLAKLREQMRRKGVRYEAGELSEAEYQAQIGKLRKEEAELAMQRTNIDPDKMSELETLEGYLDWAKGFWAKAELKVKDSYIVGYDKEGIERDGIIGGNNREIINLASGLTTVLTGDKINKRAMLQRFNISVWIKGGQGEIRGFIPTQYISLAPNLGSRTR